MLPQLGTTLEIVDPFSCVNCGREVSFNHRFVPINNHFVPTGMTQDQPAVERRNGCVWGFDRKEAVFLNYPAVSVPRGNILFPTHEGRLSSGRAIGQYGDPDLMAKFSVEYLKQYWAIVPKGRLPQSMVEMMPALHLLVNAAELAMKADLIRSGRPSGGHILRNLYSKIEQDHRDEVERRFAVAAPNTSLNALGAERPTVASVLGVYEQSFGGGSVYQDTQRRGCMGGSHFSFIAATRVIPKTVKPSSTVSSARSGTLGGSVRTHVTFISLPTRSGLEMTFPCFSGRILRGVDRPHPTLRCCQR